MSLLSLQGVSKGYGEGAAAHPVLRELSLSVQPGELVVVWGMRGSGRSTLMRVAAGIEPPDAGVVLFDGHDLARRGERLLGGGIGYCQRTLRFGDGQSALEHAMVGLLSRWVPPAGARARALRALERAGAAHCASMRRHKLTSAEAVRVALARTLALEPRVLVIDEPVKGVDLAERDGILALLRSLADEGIAVLACTGESTGLSEADRAFVLGAGELRGAPPAHVAPVLPLRLASCGGA
ncbi:MAG TPA: ATP-binding cassette domain-containing protein [Solirubrobacteraceae bacterium]|jgi:putative ABC transport system ATP-binding protein|nr:ATP-binding cassette domain-containing protein [Solirubrobacteraceae bacterium]